MNLPTMITERNSDEYYEEERNLIQQNGKLSARHVTSVNPNYRENPFTYALSAFGRNMSWTSHQSRANGAYMTSVPQGPERSNSFKERFTEKGKLPNEVISFYNKLELTTGIKLDMTARRLYYEEFYKKTSEFDMLHSSDVENLILTKLGFEIDPAELTLMVKKKMDDSLESYSDGMYGEEAFFSFELFASLICDLLQRQKLNRESRLSSLQPDQNSPLSKSKQGRAGKGHLRKVTAASVVINLLVWYEFGIFAFLAPQIGSLFFPPSSGVEDLFGALVLFGGSFAARPIGGILLGHVGDRRGRKPALMVSIVGLGISTVVIGFLPTYATAGLAAPVLLTILRIVQGMCVGGELVGSIVYTVESAPTDRQVYMGSLCMASASVGLTLASATALFLNSNLSSDQFLAYGWRIPFWLGLLLAALAVWMRKGIDESYEFRRVSNRNAPTRSRHNVPGSARSLTAGLPEIFPDTGDVEAGMANDAPQPVSPLAGSKAAGGDGSETIVALSSSLPAAIQGWPLVRGLRTHFLEILLVFLVVSIFATSTWILFTWPPTLYQDLMKPPIGYPRFPNSTINFPFGNATDHSYDFSWFGNGDFGGFRRSEYSESAVYGQKPRVWLMHTLVCGLQAVVILLSGLLGDAYGNVKILSLGILFLTIVAIPSLAAMGSGSWFGAIVGQILLISCVGVIAGNIPSWMVKTFPSEIRYSCIALSFNLAQAVFGGLAGMSATYVFKRTGQSGPVGVCLAALAAFSGTALFFSTRHSRMRAALRREQRRMRMNSG